MRRALSPLKNQENWKPYTWQRATPWDPDQRPHMQVRRFWQKSQREHRTVKVQEAFQKVLLDLGYEEAHNVFRCPNCQSEGWEVKYCVCSRHNWEHPFHVCPSYGQECC